MDRISEWLELGKRRLQASGVPSFSLDAELLLAEILETDRLFLKMNPQGIVSLESQNLYQKFLNERVSRRPFAYIVGYKYWGGMKLKVDERVLIPRDETEFLLEYVLQDLKSEAQKRPDLRILDIGTGSGALILGVGDFLKKYFSLEKVSLMGIDLDEKALEVARENASNLVIPISWIQSDLLEVIPEGSFYDVLIANLPYVPDSIVVSPEVKKEPALAIFMPGDGLDLYRKLLEQLVQKKIRFKALWIEFLPSQKTLILELFKDFEIECLSDGAGLTFFACVRNR